MIADAQPDFHDDRAHSHGIEAAGLAEPISASVETGALDNQRLQGGRVDGVTLVEIDGTYRLAVQTRVEEPFRILQLGPFWKRQPHGVLEGLAVKVHSDVNHVQGLLPVGCMIAGEISLDP